MGPAMAVSPLPWLKTHCVEVDVGCVLARTNMQSIHHALFWWFPREGVCESIAFWKD